MDFPEKYRTKKRRSDLKDRAKALANHLRKETGKTKLSADPVSVRGSYWDCLPFSQLLRREIEGYVEESIENIENLNRIKIMLQEVMSSRLSPIKQSLILSRLGQISEGQLARLSQLEWQQLNLDEIHQHLKKVGITSLHEAYKKLFDLKQTNFQLLQRIQKHQPASLIEEEFNWDLAEDDDRQSEIGEIRTTVNELISIGKTLNLQNIQHRQEASK